MAGHLSVIDRLKASNARKLLEKKLESIDWNFVKSITLDNPYEWNLMEYLAKYFWYTKYKISETQGQLVFKSNIIQANFVRLVEEHENILRNRKPLFIIVQNSNTWELVVILLSVEGNVVKIIHHHSQAGDWIIIPPVLQGPEINSIEILEKWKGSELAQDSGPIVLQTLQIYCIELNKNTYIREISFPNENRIEYIKTNLKIELVQPYIENILEELKYENKMVLGNVIKFLIESQNTFGSVVEIYRNKLLDELKKQEIDSNYQLDENAINLLKGNLLVNERNEQVQNFLELYNKLLQQDSSPEESNLKLKSNVEKLRNISEFLQGMSPTVEYNELCSYITNADLDLDSIINFVNIIPNIINNDIRMKEGSKVPSVDEIKLIELKPSQESKTEKCLNQLLAEISLDREISKDELIHFETDNERSIHFISLYTNSPTLMKLKTSIDKFQVYWNEWELKTPNEIRAWGLNMLKQKLSRIGDSDEVLEAVAVLQKTRQLTSGYSGFRLPQLISILQFLDTTTSQGKLLQIGTGEGKTCIGGVVSVIKVLQGYNVDLITSNQVLAQEGVDSMKSLYNLIGISVNVNNLIEGGKEGARACYKANVVYGTISNFQFDYLRDNFEGKGTRNGRELGYVILDEVDNLSIDNGSHIAKLAGPMPGMDTLKYVYIKIWQELIKAELDIYNEIPIELENISKSLESNIELSETGKQLEFEKKRLELFETKIHSIRDRIKKRSREELDLIPSHLKDYCTRMENEWIENALSAKYDIRENERYVLRRSKENELLIIPVDYQNTGVTMKNTIWSGALHQFIQLKHNLELTSESLTSSFISNIGYIKLYNNRMLGMTGTLGSEAEKSFLSSAYNLNYGIIPNFREKKLSIYEHCIVEDGQWLNYLTIESYLIALSGRAVLIICETIRSLKSIEENLNAILGFEKTSDKIKLKTYIDEDGFQVVHERVGSGEIIIATNIAGRGTDFKTTKDLELKGGLHVVLAFLPVNQRVQDQAIGRTARQGNKGSAQLILPEIEVKQIINEINKNNIELNFGNIFKIRDEYEKLRLLEMKNEKLINLNLQDALFNKFSILYNNFRKEKSSQGGLWLTKDLKELWAFWLHKQNFKDNKKNVDLIFEEFKQSANGLLVGNEICFNPFYAVRQADYFLKQNDTLIQAEKAILNAIKLSGEYSKHFYSAHYKKFEIEIEKGGQFMNKFKNALGKVFIVGYFIETKDEKYIENGIIALQDTINALSSEILYLNDYILKGNGSNTDLKNILTNYEDNNLLLKNLNSRQIGLEIYLENAKQLLQQLLKDKGSSIGLAINSRVSYLRELDESKNPGDGKLKESLTNSSLIELESLGMNVLYALKEVHDASSEIISSAQGLISAGLASLTAGLIFPPILPVMAPIASTLISEGIVDILMELLSKGQVGFDLKSYIKGKCISFGIALATMGFSTIINTMKFIKFAIESCKGLSAILRKSPYLKKLCETIAGQIDNLGKYFEKLKLIKEFNKLDKTSQLKKLNDLKALGNLDEFRTLGGLDKLGALENLKSLGKLQDGLTRRELFQQMSKTIGSETGFDIIMSIASEKLLIAGLENLLTTFIKPKLKEIVTSNLESCSDVKNKIKNMKEEEYVKCIEGILIGNYGEMTGEVFQEIALGVLRHCNSWKAKITSLVIDTLINTIKLTTFINSFITKLNGIQSLVKIVNNEAVEFKLMEYTINSITNKMYNDIVQLCGKYGNTFLLKPLVSKGMNYKNNKNKKKIKELEDEEFTQIAEFYKILGMEPGGSLEQVKKAYFKAALETHPNRPGGSREKFIEIKNAYDSIKNLYSPNNEINNTKNRVISLGATSPQNHTSTDELTNNTTNTRLDSGGQRVTRIEDSGDQRVTRNLPGHLGNIFTLSKELDRHIIVFDENGLIIREFNKDSDMDAIELIYHAPKKNNPNGHFSLPENIETKLKAYGQDVTLNPSALNNCLYDAISLQIYDKDNFSLTPDNLRKIAESSNFRNFVINFLVRASNKLNNSITRKLHFRARKALLVGGSLDNAKALRDNFMNSLKDFLTETVDVRTAKLKDLCSEISAGTTTPKIAAIKTIIYESEDQAGKEAFDKKLKNAMTETVGKNGGKTYENDYILSVYGNTELDVYNITNLDTFTRFILDFSLAEKRAKPFAIKFPNGTTSVLTSYLYSLVATTKNEKNETKLVIAGNQYEGLPGINIDLALRQLTTNDNHIDFKLIPELVGKLVSEPLRNKATYVSALFSMVMYRYTRVDGEESDSNFSQNKDSYPVVARKGIIWDKSLLEENSKNKQISENKTEWKNPTYLLSRIYDMAEHNDTCKEILKYTKECVAKNKSLELDVEFYQNIYKTVRHMLGQGAPLDRNKI